MATSGRWPPSRSWKKAGLFKKFAGIDVFDIEINASDPDLIVEVVAALEPTFGGINLEDIKAPECFIVERKLRERMKIPVFHDDQHGTAIIVAAAILNGLTLAGKMLADVRLAGSGAGAAALSCLNVLVSLGLKLENIHISDIAGVVYEGRAELMDPEKQRFARPTSARTLAEIMVGADVFLGLSAGGVVKCSQADPHPGARSLRPPHRQHDGSGMCGCPSRQQTGVTGGWHTDTRKGCGVPFAR